jgi:hypothetical protein
MIKQYALAAALCVAGAPYAMAAPLHISLDGFCNTFVLTLDSFEVYGKRAGCGYRVIDGGTNAEIGGVSYIIANDTQHGGKNLFTWYFTPPVKKAGSWFLYNSDGKSETEINSGTYTVGKVAGARNTRDATSP